MLLHYLVKVEKPKMHVKVTQLQLFMLTAKHPLHASNYIDSFIKCSGEPYKWTFRSEHVFKVSTPSTHTWSQMVTPLLMMFRSKSKQVCIKHFCTSSISWMFVSYTFWFITLHISKCKSHYDPGSLMKLGYIWCNFLWWYPLVILHFWCFDFHKVV